LSDPDLQNSRLKNEAIPDPYRIDKRLLRRSVDRAAASYDQHALVFDEIANRLIERLDLLNLTPHRILDLGTGNGRQLQMLKARYPRATIVGADISAVALHAARVRGRQTWWRRRWRQSPALVCMDAGARWPFADASFDLVISNMLLPWVNETDELACELERVLTPAGTFFISSAGPDTLIELRQAWESVDTSMHVNAFLDMHDVGDMFARAGLADPVMDTERIEVRYKDVETMLGELQATGCNCVLRGRRRGLMARQVVHRVASKESKFKR